MERISMLFFVSVIILFTAFFQEDPPSKKLENISLPKDMKYSKDTSKELFALIEAIKEEEIKDIELKEGHMDFEYREKYSKRVLEFIEKNKDTTAALTAKLYLAKLCFDYPEVKGEPVLYGTSKVISEQIRKEFPQSWQAKYALILIGSLIRKDKTIKDIKTKVDTAIKFFESNEKDFQLLDKENAEEFKLYFNLDFDKQFENVGGAIMLIIAALYRENQMDDKAKGVLNSIINKYPNTKMASAAEQALYAIEVEH